MSKSGSRAEFEIIRRYFSTPELSFPRDGIALAIGDDAALIDPPAGKQLAMSMDVLVAGVHFPEGAPPADIAYRALAVNLSDLAAMGAQPLCFTLGLVLPESDADWLAGFSAGLQPLAQRFDCPLVGGDTSSGPLSISIQVQGLVDVGHGLRRSGARVGDRVYVSGTLGDAAIALPALGLASHLGDAFCLNVDTPSGAHLDFFAEAYFKPEPQIALALAAGHLITSCIDISDGLQGDLQHVLEASALGARLLTDEIPFSEAARSCVSPANRLRAALFGGDDYELCFTVGATDCEELERIAIDLGLRLSCVGELVPGSGIRYHDGAGDAVEIPAEAYQHFDLGRENRN